MDSPADFSLALTAPGEGKPGDASLTAYEITDLNLARCEMTVLSESESEDEAVVDGSSDAQSWAVFVAGCPTVVINRQLGADKSPIMMRFYSHLLKGDAKGKSLREAQLAVAAKRGTAHPYYWATLSLFGDWR
jgi:hypothetical protein